MPTWMQVVLIFVSFGALIIACYCLFFMVPVKRFWERIRSLGGGMKGIEAHLSGVRDELDRRLNELASSARQQISESREAAQATLDRLAKDGRGARRDLEALRKDLQSLQAQLRGATADNSKVTQSLQSLTRELHQLRGDFDALDVELRESVRQLVGDSFASVESTVLSALDAFQEEMLHGASEPSAATRPSRLPQRPSRTSPDFAGGPTVRGRGNIITVQPLFADLRRDEKEEEADEEPQENAEETKGDDEGKKADQTARRKKTDKSNKKGSGPSE